MGAGRRSRPTAARCSSTASDRGDGVSGGSGSTARGWSGSRRRTSTPSRPAPRATARGWRSPCRGTTTARSGWSTSPRRGLTVLTDEPADHWNPTISPDGRFSRLSQEHAGDGRPERRALGAPPETDLRLLRLAGAFPAFSPDGRRLALTGGSFARLDVMNVDGTGRRTLHKGQRRGLFSISWAHHGDRIAFALGPVFAGAREEVDIATIHPDGSGFTELTRAPATTASPRSRPTAAGSSSARGAAGRRTCRSWTPTARMSAR